MVTILSTIEGHDHHDWIEELSQRTEVSFETIVLTLLHVVMADPIQQDECELFANRIAYHVECGNEGPVDGTAT